MRCLPSLAAIIAIAGAACADGSAPVEKLVPTALIKIAGDTQLALVNSAVSLSPMVEARTSSGKPVPGVAVTFAVTEGGGTSSAQTATTDASGRASTSWTLGFAGSQRLMVTANGLPNVAFTALAAAPATKIAATTPQQLAGLVSSPFVLKVVARTATDTTQRDALVLFSSTSGTVTPAQSATNAAGLAETQFTASGPRRIR